MAREKKNKIEKEKKKGKSAFRKFKNRLSFLILLAFAGFVFYMGWIQVKIPEGKYALVYTKTGGYDRYLLSPGQFIWRWENLFPENMTLHFIELKSRSAAGSLSLNLPSGDMYAEFIDRPDAFESAFSWLVTYRLKENSFVSRVREGSFSIDSMDSEYSRYEEDVQRMVSGFLKDKSLEVPMDPQAAADRIASSVNAMDTPFELESLRFTDISTPDMELYENTRAIFMEHLKQLNLIERQAEQSAAVRESDREQKMNLLREYGEVFSKYPVLLDYYGLDREKLDPGLFREEDPPPESPES